MRSAAFASLLSFCIILGAAHLAIAADAPTSNPAESGEALSERQQSLLLQLSDAEANIRALNQALARTGYKVGKAYDRIDNSLKGNEMMDRKGGGPVGWQDFYGKTARDFVKHDASSSVYHQVQRPKQFDFIYKANNDQIARAKEQVASLGQDQAALLERRQKHEADQSRLWAMLAWTRVGDREIADEPICRFKLIATGNGSNSRPKILGAIVLYLRTADRVAADSLESVQRDQGETFAQLEPRLKTAYATLRAALADATIMDGLNTDDKKIADGLKAMCKQLWDESSVVADNYHNALDRDKAREDTSKLVFRENLQESLAKFAATITALDSQIGEAARAWGITVDKSTPTSDIVSPAIDININRQESGQQPDGRATARSQGAEGGFESLFNGKSLDGWEGLPGFWSVKDGAIDGYQTKQGSKQTDLILVDSREHPGRYVNFELRLSYRLLTPQGNSGIQFRSKMDNAATLHVGGYQADIDYDGTYTGSIYDEAGLAGRRATMSNLGQKTVWETNNARRNADLPESASDLRRIMHLHGEGWNDVVLKVQGNHYVYSINGHVTTDLIDQSPKAVLTGGVIAFQLHQGFTMEIQFMDIRIRRE